MAFLDNCVAYWRLEEASGNRVDSVGANTLTDVFTVTQNPGKVGFAAQFTAVNGEQLTIADNPALSMGNIDCTFAGWFYGDTLGNNAGLISKWGGTANEYMLFLTAGPQLFFAVNNTSGAQINCQATNFGNLSTATWYYVVAWHDATADIIGVSINNTAPNTTANANGVMDSDSTFRLGLFPAGGAYWDGRLDEWGVWKRAFSAADRTAGYNGGAGLDPFSGGGAVGSKSGFRIANRIGL